MTEKRYTTTVTASLDTSVAEWVHKNYGGTGKKSRFVNEALKFFIARVEAGKVNNFDWLVNPKKERKPRKIKSTAMRPVNTKGE